MCEVVYLPEMKNDVSTRERKNITHASYLTFCQKYLFIQLTDSVFSLE